ncbi:MAG TPA: hypothetical protein DDW87_11980, partial [Firmicutes bacterium]|nr:hypothetical protein [Bacillota bacterium]
MKKFWGLLLLGLIAAVVLTSSIGSAEGIGTVVQVGINNDTYVYQEAFSEVIVLQRGKENSSSVEQVGAQHLAGVVQLGEKNNIEVKQLGQRDLLFSMQLGFKNYANITQTHPILAPSRAYISSNDAFAYQTGLYNVLNLLQIGDENTASVYQIDDNNEAFIVQEQMPLSLGANATLVVQVGIGNGASSQQLGAHQTSRTLQLGNGNRSLINQNGIDNNASVFQAGNQNTVT